MASTVRTPRGSAVRPRRRHGLVGRLNDEFAELSEAADSRLAVARWQRGGPGLAGCLSLDDVAARVSGPGEDAALRALVRSAQLGDALAGRVVLHALLGSALGLARRTAHHYGGDVEEAESVAVARLYELIVDYPLSRVGAVRDGLALDLLRTLTHRDTGPTTAALAAGDHLEALAVAVPPAEIAEALHPVGRADEDLLRLLTWAVERGALARGDAELLWCLHSPATADRARAEAARSLRISEATVRQRACRAKARLLAAVREATA